jgi:hypothetical protein
MRALVVVWLRPAVGFVTSVDRVPGCESVIHLARGRHVLHTVRALHGTRAYTERCRDAEHEHEQSDGTTIPATAIERDHDGPGDAQRHKTQKPAGNDGPTSEAPTT